MRRLLATMLQLLVDAEAAARIGAGRHERTSTRTTQRNGGRDKKLVSTAAGDITVTIPKLRSGSLFPSLLEPRRRIDVALQAVIMQAWVEGVSTRKVDDLVAALGIESGISKSEVSRICGQLDTEVAAWRSRDFAAQAMPYVFLDATYCKARINGRVVSRAVVIATGVSADGRREVLGCDVGDSENEDFWTEFLCSLRDRGLHGVQLVISDAHRGLVAAIGAVCADAAWQRSSGDISTRRDGPVGHLHPPGEDLGSVTFEVQRQTRPSRRRQGLVLASGSSASSTEMSVQPSRPRGTELLGLPNRQLAGYDTALERLLAQHPDAPIFRSFPGVGLQTAAVLLSEIGEDRSYYPTVGVLLAEAGLAPLCGNTRLRDVCTWWAYNSLRPRPGRAPPTTTPEARKQPHHRALRGLGARWMRVLWRAWTDGVPYDQARHLSTLHATTAVTAVTAVTAA